MILSVFDIIKFYEDKGGAAAYLASLEAAKTSDAADLPEIVTSKPPVGTVTVTICTGAGGHYTVETALHTDPFPYAGGGNGYSPSVRDCTFEGEWFFIKEDAEVDDLVNYGPTPCTWYETPTGTIGVVYQKDKTPLMHISGAPSGAGLNGVTMSITWYV